MPQSPKLKQGTLHSNKKLEDKISNFNKVFTSLYKKIE